MIEERPLDRRLLVRNALIYAPTSFIVLGLLFIAVASAIGGAAGAFFPSAILAVVAFAVVFELIAALRDLRSEPTLMEGEAARIWKKSKFLFFGRQDYLLVDGKVFEIGAVAATELQAGQQVSIRHWPHTMRVITLARIRETSKRVRTLRDGQP